MERELNNASEQEKFNRLKPVTPEMIHENPNFLGKVYDQLIMKKKEWIDQQDAEGRVVGKILWEHVDYQSLIDFGEQYEKTNLETVLFYFGYKNALLTYSSSGAKPVEDYIKLLSEDKEKAAAYAAQYRAEMNEMAFGKNEAEDEWVRNFMARGFDLSTIIPGAPTLITEPPPEGKAGEPTFDSRNTEFAAGITNSDASRKLLSEIFHDKTLIDLGAGAQPTALRNTAEFGIKNYVAVEPFNTDDLLWYTEMAVGDYFSDKQKSTSHPEKIHIAKTDMKTFLEKLPDNVENSVFLISGIDQFILGTIPYDAVGRPASRHIAEGEQYADVVVRELNRVLGKNSIVIMYNSNFDFTKPEHNFIIQELKTSYFPTLIIRKSEQK